MPEQLLEARVFRASGTVTANAGGNPPGTLAITPDVVPAGQTWRVDHLAVAMFSPSQEQFPLGGATAPLIIVWDDPAPGPTAVPCQFTYLQEQNWPAIFPASTLNCWLDVDDAPNLMLEAGRQLAITYFGALETEGFGPIICAARAQVSIFQGTPAAPQPVAGYG